VARAHAHAVWASADTVVVTARSRHIADSKVWRAPSGENHIITPVERVHLTGRLLLEARVQMYEHKTEPQVWVPGDGPLGVDRDHAEVEAAVARAPATCTGLLAPAPYGRGLRPRDRITYRFRLKAERRR
jgi:hypothetical protein